MLVEEEIIINAPADKVYQIVKDMGRYPEFIPSLKKSQFWKWTRLYGD